MKKILLNAYTNLNFGDDLFLRVLFDRYPNVRWVLPTGEQKYSKIFEEYSNVKVKNGFLFKIKNKLGINYINNIFSRYDAGLYIGGSIFMQLGEWDKYLQQRRRLIQSFYKKNKPYFILGSNFGPYEDEIFLNEYKSLLKLCNDVCFRDNYSYNIFKDYSNVRLAPDIVFQLKTNNIAKIKNSIGISIIDISNRKDLNKYNNQYIYKLKEIIEECIKRNKTVKLFSFCEREGDLSAINKVLELFPTELSDKIDIINYNGDIDEFLNQFASVENIIGTRFHSCILSQVFSQGLYSFIYSDKTYNVLKDIGLEANSTYIKDIEDVNVNKLLDVISKNKINDISIFKQSEMQFERLDKYVSTK